MKVRFTAHAKDKISRLSELGITREKVIGAVKSPETSEKEILIVTVNPGNRRRYT